MTDLIEKLRAIAEWNHNDFREITDIGPVLETVSDAANEIQRLRNALVLVANLREHEYPAGENAYTFARATLESGSQFPCPSPDD